MKVCLTCEVGQMQRVNLRGASLDYRDELGLIFDDDLHVMRCDNAACGDMQIKGTQISTMNDVLERLRRERKQQSAQHFLRTAEQLLPDIPRAMWEDILGLSRGYLSRIATGTRQPDSPLEILLEGFSKEPRSALVLIKAAGRLPSAVDDAVATRHGTEWLQSASSALPAR